MPNHMEIVTGSTGLAHVTPIDDAVRNSNFGYYSERIVFDLLRNFEASVITSNEIRIYSGYGMMQGRLFKIDKGYYDTVQIRNGRQNIKRADLIVAKYTFDSEHGVEAIELDVIEGPEGSSYVDPDYSSSQSNINEGGEIDVFPLYRVRINGLTVTQDTVDRLFTPTPDGGRLGIIEQKIAANLKTDLASETAGKLDGSSDVDLGVKGILPITHGGTGANTAAGAAKNVVIGAMAADTEAMSDSTEFVTSESGNGFVNNLKKRAATNIWAYIQSKIKVLLGMGNTDIIPVLHGGTGKTSIGNNKILKGNASGGFDEVSFVTSLDGENTSVPSSKAVADAMSAAGYGDMLKADYTTGENEVIKVAKGGTGSTDGTINGVKLAVSGTSKGYIDSQGNFKSFRQPTGNAAVGEVLSGKTFANANNDSLTGTMTNNGAVSPAALNCGGSYTIPAGYHNGSGMVTAKTLASQTGVDSGKTAVAAAQMLTGYQGWVNGNKVSGTMANKGAWTGATTGSGNVTIPAGYHNGSGYVSGSGAYNAGVNAQKGAHWNQYWEMDGHSSNSKYIIGTENIQSWSLSYFPQGAGDSVRYRYQINGSWQSYSSLTKATSGITVPTGATRLEINLYNGNSSSDWIYGYFTCYANKLH